MTDENSIKILKQIRTDCMYGKKRHYNANDRFSRKHTCLGIWIVVITSFMGTSVFITLSEQSNLPAKIITGVLVVVDAVLAGLQTFFNFEKRAFSHKTTADKYLALMKKANRFIAYHADKTITSEQLKKEIEEISNEIKNLQAEAPETSRKDYDKAREGVKDGEEEYTEEETR
jgi:hypothetical protein